MMLYYNVIQWSHVQKEIEQKLKAENTQKCDVLMRTFMLIIPTMLKLRQYE